MSKYMHQLLLALLLIWLSTQIGSAATFQIDAKATAVLELPDIYRYANTPGDKPPVFLASDSWGIGQKRQYGAGRYDGPRRAHRTGVSKSP